MSEQFYAELNSAIKAPARFLVFVCGDFNSKLGKRTAADIEAGLDSCIGAHGMGTRNENGEALANFLAIHVFLPATQLSITQVATRLRGQAGSRIRTHHQVHLRQLPSTPKLTYVLCKQNAKLMLQDARSYGGATLSSDHKPVVARLRFDRRCLMYKQPKKRYPQTR